MYSQNINCQLFNTKGKNGFDHSDRTVVTLLGRIANDKNSTRMKCHTNVFSINQYYKKKNKNNSVNPSEINSVTMTAVRKTQNEAMS